MSDKSFFYFLTIGNMIIVYISWILNFITDGILYITIFLTILIIVQIEGIGNNKALDKDEP